MTIKRKITLGFGFVLTAAISFFIGVNAVLGLQYFFDKITIREVRTLRDIDFAKDDIFKDASDFHIEGYVKKGSVGKQTMNKGSVVYIQFPIVLREKDIEYVK